MSSDLIQRNSSVARRVHRVFAFRQHPDGPVMFGISEAPAIGPSVMEIAEEHGNADDP
jgi:hypothetical protein